MLRVVAWVRCVGDMRRAAAVGTGLASSSFIQSKANTELCRQHGGYEEDPRDCRVRKRARRRREGGICVRLS